jgi:hypothetical protein
MKKQTKEDFLPDDLVWAAGGHASDVVLTAMADGQIDVVPPIVIAHVDACRTCTTHLGNAALLSLHAGRELAMVARQELTAAQAAATPPPLPRLAIALGLVVAVLGLVPRFVLDGASTLAGAKTFAIHDVPLLVSGASTLGRRVLEPGSPVGLGLTYGAATLLVIMALAVVRLLPKKEVSR